MRQHRRSYIRYNGLHLNCQFTGMAKVCFALPVGCNMTIMETFVVPSSQKTVARERRSVGNGVKSSASDPLTTRSAFSDQL